MSIVTLKAKCKAKMNISGRMPRAKMGLHGPYGNSPSFSDGGGGFSINGPYRNIGRVGQNHLFSKGGAKCLSKTNVPNDLGSSSKTMCCQPGPRCNGSSKSINNFTSFCFTCCADEDKISKPSVLNTKGMLSYKNKWIKRNFTDDCEFPDHIQYIYNRWVQDTNSDLNISSRRTYILSNNTSACKPRDSPQAQDAGKYKCDQNKANSYSVNSACKDQFIGGKKIPYKRYTKTVNVSDSNIALNNEINNRGGLNPKGFQKPYPYSVNNKDSCANPTKQANEDLAYFEVKKVNIDIKPKQFCPIFFCRKIN